MLSPKLFTVLCLSGAVLGGQLSAVERLRKTKPNVFKNLGDNAKRDSIKSPLAPRFSNPDAAQFHVNSSTLPLVTFPLQESWAGRLPISGSADESRQLFFWYWPSSQPSASKTLSIWLNGGPGCSSLAGFLQENGPISFQPGMSSPQANPNAWTTVSDILWIEQPVGTGFSLGDPNITNESELADQFYGFLQQFYTIFPELVSKQLFITGESYAGYYIPYIATRIVDASANEQQQLPLDLQGLLINDGVYSSFVTGEEIPAADFAAKFRTTLGLTTKQVSQLQSQAVSCGYQAVLNQVTYPPKGKISLPHGDSVSNSCDVASRFYDMAGNANPCFNIYRITDQCPTPNDPIGDYFSRSDVQDALHVSGFGEWSECSNGNVFVNGIDDSPYTETLFPHLLDTLPRGVTLWHGLDDSILFNVGDRITIQNMTWGGLQGFQTAPATPLTVGGVQKGIFHTERKLTYIEVNNAGHMIEMDQPAAALHVFQSVLGQVTL